MNIGNVIINLLDKNNMSQRELALKLKIAPTTLNGYIKNKHEPDCTTLKNIAKIFGVSIDYLLEYIPYEDNEEKQLVSDYHKLTEQQKELLTAIIKVMIKQNTINDSNYSALP